MADRPTPSYVGEPICGCYVENMLRERLADATTTLTELAPSSDRAALDRVRALAQRLRRDFDPAASLDAGTVWAEIEDALDGEA